MKKMKTCNGIVPAGHYSVATIHKDMVYISGQLPIDGISGEKVMGSMEDQVKTVLKNLDMILKEAGSCKEQVLKVSIYIPDVGLWGQVDQLYSDYFEAHKPARVIVPTRDLHYGFSIEIDAIAYI